METEKTVLAALEVLYQKHLQPDQQQAADAYLRTFQLTPEAFGVCVSLLERFLPQCVAVSTTAAQQQQQAQLVPILFFASQTLANKLRRQHAFPDRSTASYVTWSTTIIAWFAASHAAIPKLVQTQLVLALVACLPRIPPADLEAHVAATGGNSNINSNNSTAASLPAETGAISFALRELTRAGVAPAIVTELLVVVVEEVHELHERNARERLQNEVNNLALPMLNDLLPQLMRDAAASSPTQQLVLRAVRNWLRYASIPSTAVVQNPLIQSLVAFLHQDALFDVTVDLIVEIVRCYNDAHHDAALLQWLVPQLMTLRPTFHRAVAADDSDQCLGLCRIFTEMAESFVPLLLTAVDDRSSAALAQAAVVVDLLLDCMSVPDVELADVTIPFWLRFLEELLRIDDRSVLSVKLETLGPALLRLATVALQHIQFDATFPQLPLDKQQDIKAFRHELGDVLRDVCALLGVEPLVQHCVEGLQTIFHLPTSERRWEAVEAHLFCFRSIARHIERAPSSVVDAPIELIFQHLAQFSDHPAIGYTSCLIIARYSHWLAAHPTFLPQQLTFLNENVMLAMQHERFRDWDVARAAAAAMRAIATDCWATVGVELTAFYLHVEAHALLSIDDQAIVLEGMCCGVRATRDAPQIQQLIDHVLEPIGRRMSTLFAVEAAATGSARTAVAVGELTRLICLYDHLDVDPSRLTGTNALNPLMTLTERVWPLLNELLVVFGKQDDVVERVCRCYKRILRTCGASFVPFVPQLVDNIVNCYRRAPKSAFLYAANMVLKYYGRNDRNEDMQPLFATLVRVVAETTFPLFQTRATIQLHPDVIEEFFFLMQRSVQNVPQVLVRDTNNSSSNNRDADVRPQLLLDSLFECALATLDVSHNDANKAALCFLEETFVAAAAHPSFHGVLQQRLVRGANDSSSAGGPRLVHQLLAGIVLGAVPAMRLEADYGSVAGVLVQLAKLDGQKLQEWIAAWFIDAIAVVRTPASQHSTGGASSPAAGFLTLDDATTFQRDLFASPNERTFRRVVRHFGKLCASRNTSLGSDDDDRSSNRN